MKLLRTCFQFAALSCLTALAATGVQARVWKASIVPASLNPDNTICLVGDSTQLLGLFLQADDEVTKSKTRHNLVLEWDLPPGFAFVGNGGCSRLMPGKPRCGMDALSLLNKQRWRTGVWWAGPEPV